MRHTINILSLFIIFSCSTNVKTIVNNEIENILLSDFEHIPANSVIKEIEYISLESADVDQYPVYISKIVKLENKFIISDNYSKKIIVFNEKGQFISSVGKIGNGPGEYLGCHDFSVDNQGNIYVLDAHKKQILVYDSSYIYVKTTPIEYSAELIFKNDLGYILSLAPYNIENNTENKQLILVDENGKFISDIINYSDYVDDNYYIESYFREGGEVFAYNRPLNDTLNIITTQGVIKKQYVFDFGNSKVPDEKKTDVEDVYISAKYGFITNFVNVAGDNVLITFSKDGKDFTMLCNNNNKKAVLIDHLSTRYEDCLLKYPSLTIGDSVFVTSINQDSFSEVDSMQIKLPSDVKSHIDKGNITLCLVKYDF